MKSGMLNSVTVTLNNGLCSRLLTNLQPAVIISVVVVVNVPLVVSVHIIMDISDTHSIVF